MPVDSFGAFYDVVALNCAIGNANGFDEGARNQNE